MRPASRRGTAKPFGPHQTPDPSAHREKSVRPSLSRTPNSSEIPCSAADLPLEIVAGVREPLLDPLLYPLLIESADTAAPSIDFIFLSEDNAAAFEALSYAFVIGLPAIAANAFTYSVCRFIL